MDCVAASMSEGPQSARRRRKAGAHDQDLRRAQKGSPVRDPARCQSRGDRRDFVSGMCLGGNPERLTPAPAATAPGSTATSQLSAFQPNPFQNPADRTARSLAPTSKVRMPNLTATPRTRSSEPWPQNHGLRSKVLRSKASRDQFASYGGGPSFGLQFGGHSANDFETAVV